MADDKDKDADMQLIDYSKDKDGPPGETRRLRAIESTQAPHGEELSHMSRAPKLPAYPRGSGYGHRVAHCHNPSPYADTGYILTRPGGATA